MLPCSLSFVKFRPKVVKIKKREKFKHHDERSSKNTEKVGIRFFYWKTLLQSQSYNGYHFIIGTSARYKYQTKILNPT